MSWYTINDPSCKFDKSGSRVFGEVNGRVYELTDAGFQPSSVKKNPYMPDEIVDPMVMHARMLPHHLAYAKEKVKRLGRRALRRNGPFLPTEVKNIISTHAKMLPHHLSYAKGAFHDRFGN